MSEISDWNRKIIDEFRANDGKVGGPFEGAAMLILHTKGRKSGTPRENPLVYRPVDGAMAIVASKGGAPSHPDWYRNLMANPRTTVELGTGTVDVVAREAVGDERERIWTDLKRVMPGFAEYENRTAGVREIPVIVLDPA